jgi:hypothetical protein
MKLWQRGLWIVGDALAWPGELLAFSLLGRWKPVFYLAWWLRAPGDHLRCWVNRQAGMGSAHES